MEISLRHSTHSTTAKDAPNVDVETTTERSHFDKKDAKLEQLRSEHVLSLACVLFIDLPPSIGVSVLAYSREQLVELVTCALNRNPTATLTDIGAMGNVARHTLRRALRHELGCNFRELRRVAIAAELQRVAVDLRPQSLKEIAVKLGYAQSRSLNRASHQQFGCSVRTTLIRMRIGKS